MSQLFASGGQSTRASASASVPSMNIQGWFILGLTDLISLVSNRLSRNFSSTIPQKHQPFTAQPSLWSNFYFHTWLLEKPYLRLLTFVGKVMSLFFKVLSRLVIAFLPRSKCLNFMAAVTIWSDFGAQENNVSLLPLSLFLFAIKC